MSDITHETEEEAPRPRTDRAITVIGPSGSGKTLMIATLLNDEGLANDIISAEPDVESVMVIPEHREREAVALSILDDTYFRIMAGGDAEATRSPYNVTFGLHIRRHTEVKGSILSLRRSGRRDISATNFVLWDAPGGHMTGDFVSHDESVLREKLEFKRALNSAEAVIICVSVLDKDYKDQQINALEAELKDLINNRGSSPLRRIIVCLTKFDALFQRDGTDAYKRASDPDEVAKRLRAETCERYGNLFAVLKHLNGHHYEQTGAEIEVRVFPVSTFGFVKGEGAANFYDHKKWPGLMTRTISGLALDTVSDEDNRPMRDHYPVEMLDAKAKPLWRPFNLLQPLYFAAEGRIAGDHCLSLDMLQPDQRVDS